MVEVLSQELGCANTDCLMYMAKEAADCSHRVRSTAIARPSGCTCDSSQMQVGHGKFVARLAYSPSLPSLTQRLHLGNNTTGQIHAH
jgi:hypothetical protein